VEQGSNAHSKCAWIMRFPTPCRAGANCRLQERMALCRANIFGVGGKLDWMSACCTGVGSVGRLSPYLCCDAASPPGMPAACL